MLFMTYGLDKIHRWSLSFPGKSARSTPNRIGKIPGPGVTNITAPSRMSPNASRFLRMRNGMRTDAGFLSSQLYRLTLVNASAGISTRIQGITTTPIVRAIPEIHRTASLEIHCSIIQRDFVLRRNDRELPDRMTPQIGGRGKRLRGLNVILEVRGTHRAIGITQPAIARGRARAFSVCPFGDPALVAELPIIPHVPAHTADL